MSNHDESDRTQNLTSAGLTSRRHMLKKAAVGAAAAGVVWSAPRIEGLSVRPSYAAAGSGGGQQVGFANLTFDYNGTQSRFDAFGSGALGNGNIQTSGHYDAPTGLLGGPVLVTVNRFTYNGTGTALISSMKPGGTTDVNQNLLSPTPAAGPSTPLPAGDLVHYSAMVKADRVNNESTHRLTLKFKCV